MPTRMERRAERIRLQRREIARWLAELAVVLLAALLVRAYVFSLTTVQGPSMMDTLQSGQVVAVDKTYFHLHEPQRGMVVICRYPGSRDYFVKRIAALEGDVIEISQGVTYVNGQALEEDYVSYPCRDDFGPYTVEEGCVFVLGDNRANSHDSRSEGALSEDMIVGRVVAVFFPLGQAHFLTDS